MTLAWRVLYSTVGGGDLQEARNTGRPPPRSRSELAGSSENGRGYEPRLKRQRTVLYDRLAWTFQNLQNLGFRFLRGMEGRLSAGPPFEPGQRF